MAAYILYIYELFPIEMPIKEDSLTEDVMENADLNNLRFCLIEHGSDYEIISERRISWKDAFSVQL